MPEGPATILGGLPVIAEVWFTRGDGWTTTLGWTSSTGASATARRGRRSRSTSSDRCEAKDPYWEADVTEQVSEHLAFERWEAELRARIPHHPTCSPDYPEKPKGEPAQ